MTMRPSKEKQRGQTTAKGCNRATGSGGEPRPHENHPSNTNDDLDAGESVALSSSSSSLPLSNPQPQHNHHPHHHDADNDDDGDDDDESAAVSYQTKDDPHDHSQQSNSNNKTSTTTTKTRAASTIIVVTLIIAGFAFGAGTFFHLYKSEENVFESDFRSFAREVASVSENNAESVFGQLRSLATAMTAMAVTEELTFPQVTMTHFGLRAKEIADLTGAELILFVPFVEQRTKQSYEQYAVENQYWIEQDIQYLGADPSSIEPIQEQIYNYTLPDDYVESRRGFVDSGFMDDILSSLGYETQGFSAPVAQYGPGLKNSSLVMLDLFSHPIIRKEIVSSLEYSVPVISETEDLDFLMQHVESPKQPTQYNMLRSFTLDPVKEDFNEGSRTVGFVLSVISWSTFFGGLLPDNVDGIAVRVVSDCGRNFTYIINGSKNDWAADGDHHSPDFNHLTEQYQFFWKDHPMGTSRHCHFDLFISPTNDFAEPYFSSDPYIYSSLVLGILLLAAAVFYLYDRIMQMRQERVVDQFQRAEHIVQSLFPQHVGKQLMKEVNQGKAQKANAKDAYKSTSSEDRLKRFMGGEKEEGEDTSKPIADLYPETTVFFADIVGFTAWSSTREPTQVFSLLETLYRDFDKAAKARKVFKVETIGDCYVAVCGLPEPRKDHHVAMAKFAQQCLTQMSTLCISMASELGPDTAVLGLRVGLHSGPVTAGVLRGERARFQLFGDTVNTAARMESTGKKNCIQISEQTARRLKESNKGHWIEARADKVNAKGKGVLQTYWLTVAGEKSSAGQSDYSATTSTAIEDCPNNGVTNDQKRERLVQENTELLNGLLKAIARRRRIAGVVPESSTRMKQIEHGHMLLSQEKRVIDEVVEVIRLDDSYKGSIHSIGLEDKEDVHPQVTAQLGIFIEVVSRLYQDNPFHNFEHATYVANSVAKLFGHMDNLNNETETRGDNDIGLTNVLLSDPLTQFAVIFSALIHDVDHAGVSNSALAGENPALGSFYKHKSIAEQNSVDLAWHILMGEDFTELRWAIYATEDEFRRFRQIVVNTVLATDLIDKDLKKQRSGRWNKAFQATSAEMIVNGRESANRKATIAIEYLIQAADVAHTMQPWQVYRKWNERLFREMYTANKDGRTRSNPTTFWYQGELGFFDFCVIPLARKLKESGLLGESDSEEYLRSAWKNRQLWEKEGVAVVAEMQKKICQKM